MLTVYLALCGIVYSAFAFPQLVLKPQKLKAIGDGLIAEAAFANNRAIPRGRSLYANCMNHQAPSPNSAMKSPCGLPEPF
jgi:hypothetical protein